MRELANKINRESVILNDYTNEQMNVRVTVYLTLENEVLTVVRQHGEVISITQAL